MERTNCEDNIPATNFQFPFAVCPRCEMIQSTPILDKNRRTQNLVCIKCKNKFCSYCNGDRHFLVSCRKPLPIDKCEDNQYRV